jgi:hypothetical protein
VRATWRIANLTTCDLYGQDPRPPNPTPSQECPVRTQRVGLGRFQEGQSPSWGREAAQCERAVERPLLVETRISDSWEPSTYIP